MLENQKAKKPEGKPGDNRSKEKSQEAFSPNEPAAEGGDEVGGRDLRNVGGYLIYPSYWHHGTYIWHVDYEVYSGWHWHPNPNSPVACDQDCT